LSVNAYYLADLLTAKEKRNKEQVYSLFYSLAWCAVQYIKAFAPAGCFFPTYPEVPSGEYLDQFKNYAASLGIAIRATDMRNNLASPDSSVRTEEVQLAKNWIVAASKIGTPVLRVFAGAIPDGDENNWEVPV
jgi:sugar phosphate isomerase/epimerase